MAAPDPEPTPSRAQSVGPAGSTSGARAADATTPAAPAAGDGADPRDASMGELLKRLSQDTSQLVKLEIELARAEMTQKAKPLQAGAGMLGLERGKGGG